MSKRILVVDDSRSIRKMISFILCGAGYEVVEAADGQEGLDKARLAHMDLVLTDQNMGQMDGMMLVRSLRALPEYKAIPILILTTESSDEIKGQGKAAGATGWMVKPFDPARLLEVVKKFIG